MEAPNKVYLSKTLYGTYQYQVSDPDDDTQVEYVRKDALIEKVCEWLDINIADYLNVNKSGILTANMSQLFEDLKKHMEDNL